MPATDPIDATEPVMTLIPDNWEMRFFMSAPGRVTIRIWDAATPEVMIVDLTDNYPTAVPHYEWVRQGEATWQAYHEYRGSVQVEGCPIHYSNKVAYE